MPRQQGLAGWSHGRTTVPGLGLEKRPFRGDVARNLNLQVMERDRLQDGHFLTSKSPYRFYGHASTLRVSTRLGPSQCIGRDEADQLLRHLGIYHWSAGPGTGSTRRAGSDHHNLSSRDSKVAPHQEDDCSAGGIDLAEQLSTVRRHYNRLLLDMQAIAIQRLPAGMTVSDFAAAAIAGALSPHVEHPWIGE